MPGLESPGPGDGDARVRGTMREGGPFDYVFVGVIVIDGERIRHSDLFDVKDDRQGAGSRASKAVPVPCAAGRRARRGDAARTLSSRRQAIELGIRVSSPQSSAAPNLGHVGACWRASASAASTPSTSSCVRTTCRSSHDRPYGGKCSTGRHTPVMRRTLF